MPHPWKVGDEVWVPNVSGELYAPELRGRVLYVGRIGFTVRLVKPDKFGSQESRFTFDCPRIWPTEAEAAAWCAENVGPWHKMRRE